MLPSISNLLTNNHDPPILNLSPASPILLPSTPPHSDKSPRHLSIISPMLSPIDSPHSLPPLQGDDPPQRLRLPSPSPQPTSPISPKHMLNKWPTPSASSSTSSSTASSASISSSPPLPSISAPSLRSFRHQTLGEDSHSHHHSYRHYHHQRFTQSASPSPPPLHHELQVPQQRQRSVSASHEIPNTQIVFDASGQPVLKRRRGRPPTMRDASSFDGGWTFLAPTVWDVHVSEEQKEREIQADQRINNAPITLPHTSNEHLMNDAMNAFTNSNMDTLLHMPRKKRGRKPKTHIAGNSCFVWKDLTSTRSPNNTSATAAPKK
ncbi:hypothetical protein [Parasitella parasitica]|uniref:Uncharacterized protein n=1 Tax=Parasitella parasitica TaxID=35722 RepID=A0A0B7NFA0_9FUNG|nr:hypothetical protein [Parasitella parasitica]